MTARKPDRRRSKAPDHSVIPSLVHEAQVTSLINLAARLTGKAARIRMGAIGAWPGQIPLLLWLLDKEGAIQKELVERANMEQSTVAEHLDRLERNGFVYRKQGTEDRRKYRFYPTEKAKAASADLIEMLDSGARTFTAGISRKDLTIFIHVIRQIIDRLEEYVDKANTAGSGISRRVRPRAGDQAPKKSTLKRSRPASKRPT